MLSRFSTGYVARDERVSAKLSVASRLYRASSRCVSACHQPIGLWLGWALE